MGNCFVLEHLMIIFIHARTLNTSNISQERTMAPTVTNCDHGFLFLQFLWKSWFLLN